MRLAPFQVRMILIVPGSGLGQVMGEQALLLTAMTAFVDPLLASDEKNSADDWQDRVK